MDHKPTSILSPDQYRNICQGLSEYFPIETSLIVDSTMRTGPCLIIWDVSPFDCKVYTLKLKEGQSFMIGDARIADTRMETKPIDIFQFDPGGKTGDAALAVGIVPGSEYVAWIGKGVFIRTGKRWGWEKRNNTTIRFIEPGKSVYGILSPWFSFKILGVES